MRSRRAGTPAGRRRCGPARPARGQRERVGVPLVGEEARRQPGEDRVALALEAARHVEPADLRRRAAPDLRARRRRQQLRAEADAEHRHAQLQRVAQQLDLRAHPRQPVGVADVHAAAEDRDRVEVRRRGRERLPGAGHPLGQLVAAGLAALREQAARSTAGMPDT